MKKIEIHPMSVTVGAAVAVLLLFACSSGSGGRSTFPPLQPTPSVSTQVTFYADASTPIGVPWGSAYAMGTTAAPTVITDISWAGNSREARLLVNGSPVYAWGFGGEVNSSGVGYSSPSNLTLANGIRVPAGAVLTVEASGLPRAVSLAGYTQ